jgi:opine dehydrogenase
MRITVAGMGNAGTAISADLTRMGHEVTLLKTSDAIHQEHHKILLNTSTVELHEANSVSTIKLYKVTTDFFEALSTADLVFVFLQTSHHESFIRKVIPYLKDGQVVVLEPGYLSTAFLVPHLSKIDLTIIEATSTPVDCRITKPGSVRILYRNVRNPIAVYPKVKEQFAMKLLSKIDYNFILKRSVVEVAIHNPNLIVHTAGGILSIPRVEKTDGEYYMYREVFTPSVWKIVTALDNEKMNILEKLGFDRVPYVEACRERNSIDLNVDAEAVFFEYANTSTLKAPTSVQDRFITEDVPQGLVMLESFGLHYGIQTPICTALIEISSAALGINFRKSGRTLERLGLDAVRTILEDSFNG